MSNYLRIERIPYEEPYHVQLVWDVSNGNIKSRFEYYDNADALTEIGKRLATFPRQIGDIFLYEIGSEKPEDRFAYYFRLQVFTTNSRGSSAIQIRFCNNRDLPYREVFKFCIQTEPAAINRLSKLFLEFAKLEHEYLAWSDSESFIGSKHEYA
ncbi:MULTISPECIES: hypothetical protein [unclassified Shewanella]|uniref:hypothetical protein n=1 Tax=unclassified Shewanella TaxID=196818 RepID=UPI0021DAC75B|nr:MULTISPECIES: hypothetical protein [unclassified Shewanella]MCU8021544.1 hypothetical protein [Shewanella sp. SM78]MCU8078741.1 hypothetical protein [Shewanella sp. SM103]